MKQEVFTELPYIYTMKTASLLIGLAILISLSACTGTPSLATADDHLAVKVIMSEQLDAWNDGNLEGFMEHYIHSDDLRFGGSRGISYGWDTLYAMYSRSFPNRDKMGKLIFDIDSVLSQPKDMITVDGRWTIHRNDTVGGHFVLLFDKSEEGKWQIIEDHTW